MIINLLCLFLSCSLYASDSPTNYQTPLKADNELRHATMMDLMIYEEMRAASQDKKRVSLPKTSFSTFSTPELRALKDASQIKKISPESIWQDKFDEYCYQATCASGIAATVGMLLGCAAPAMFGLSMGPLKGCCLGMLGSTPVCACITCYYAQAHNTEVNKIERYNAHLEQAIQAREMAE